MNWGDPEVWQALVAIVTLVGSTLLGAYKIVSNHLHHMQAEVAELRSELLRFVESSHENTKQEVFEHLDVIRTDIREIREHILSCIRRP